jgi:hypothetical protein
MPGHSERRVGLERPLRLVCSCGKRLGEAGRNPLSSGPLDDVAFVVFVPCRAETPVVSDDWFRAHCPKCGRTWEGQRYAIGTAYYVARDRGADWVNMADMPPKRRRSAGTHEERRHGHSLELASSGYPG